MSSPTNSRQDSDSGMTLVELLVSISLGLIVLALLASMMLGVYGTQERVTSSSTLASQSQVASEVFRSALRSSTAVRLTNVTVNSRPGQLLLTRTLNQSNPGSVSPSATCIAFLWVSGASDSPPGALYFANGSSSSAIPSSTTATGWTTLVAAAEQLADPLGGAVPLPVFSTFGSSYQMKFNTDPSRGPQTTISVVGKAPELTRGVSTGCF